jgi:hypothetical protein
VTVKTVKSRCAIHIEDYEEVRNEVEIALLSRKVTRSVLFRDIKNQGTNLLFQAYNRKVSANTWNLPLFLAVYMFSLVSLLEIF